MGVWVCEWVWVCVCKGAGGVSDIPDRHALRRQGYDYCRSFTQPYPRAQLLCEIRGGRPGLPVPDKPYGFCGRKATPKHPVLSEFRSCVKVEVAFLAPRPNEPYGFRGRKAILNRAHALVSACP